MKKMMIILTVILFAALAASPAFARGWGGQMGPGYGGDFTSAPGLNLTAEQKARIDTLRITFLNDIKPLQDSLYNKQGDMKLLWLERNPDQAKITALQNEIRALRDQIQDRATNHRLTVLNTLTPAQQETLRAYGYGPAGRGFGPGMGHGPGHGRGMSMMGY